MAIPTVGEERPSVRGTAAPAERQDSPRPPAGAASTAVLGWQGPGTPVVWSLDRRIGDPAISYVDPEVASATGLVAWQDDLGHIWVCQLDRQTGDLIPPDGRGQYLAQGVPLFSSSNSGDNVFRVINGPEWGFSQRGAGVYFLFGDNALRYQIGRVQLNDLTFEAVTPPSTQAALGAFPSEDVRDPVGRVLYSRLVEPPDQAAGRIASEWIEEDRPRAAAAFPLDSIGSVGPRWIPGQRAIVTNVADGDRVRQIARHDIDTGETTLLTTGPEPKADAVFFAAPEFPGELVFSCIVAETEIAFYRQVGPGWQEIGRVAAPQGPLTAAPPSVSSAEPFVYRGRSLVVYVATDRDDSTRICVGSLDGTINARISRSSPLRQVDPEVVVFDDRLFVHYWTSPDETGVNQLHLCQVRLVP